MGEREAGMLGLLLSTCQTMSEWTRRCWRE